MLNRSAFTLIELLIVVTIIGVLAAIAVPNFLNAQTRAKLSRVKSDLRAAEVALEAYHIDNNAYPYPFTVPPNRLINVLVLRRSHCPAACLEPVVPQTARGHVDVPHNHIGQTDIAGMFGPTQILRFVGQFV